MYLLSKNDLRLTCRDVCKSIQAIENLPEPTQEKSMAAEEMIYKMVTSYPLPLAPENLGACQHGYENKCWCARCCGTLDENFIPIPSSTKLETV